jgi:eukaryotic-like serine/threonine-protein kinase
MGRWPLAEFKAMNERTIFLDALDIDDPGERASYIITACGDDPDLRDRVERLLKAHEQAVGFMAQPAPDLVSTIERPPAAEGTGTVVGPYKLLEQIGEGGFGVVFMAEQQRPVHRRVALKVLKPGMDTKQVIARFEAERQALAVMDHANIAKVFDAGETATGRPFFVMELVKGVPITEYCDEHRLTPRERLELFVPICHAIQHAHQKGIIHRDLKPSNVLVSASDGKPAVKVIDFGVAKAAGLPLTDKTLFTGFAQIVGTPLYMSPEQAAQSADIDTRSDIYSLGVLLYELLTGTTPFSKERFKEAAYDEIRRIIREEEPPKPSTRLSDSKDSLPSISAQRHTEPAKLTKLVRGELDWIVMKALEKDRTRRYETANGFAMDVQRYLADEPVQAARPSPWHRFRKFARRNRAPVGTAILVALALVAGTAVALWQAADAKKNAALARQSENDAVAAKADLEKANEKLKQSRDEAFQEKRRADERAAEAERNEGQARNRLYVSDMRLAQQAWDDAQIGRLLELLDGQRPERTGGTDLRGFEWYYGWRLCHSDLLTLKGHTGVVRSLAYSPDGNRIVSGSVEIKVWDAVTGLETLTFEGLHNVVSSLAWSPDGKRIVSGSYDKTVKVWEVATGRETMTLHGHTFFVTSVAWSPDGKQIVSGSSDKTLKVWDAATGQETLSLKGHTGGVTSVAWRPDGKWIVSGSDDRTVKVWDAATGREILTLKGHSQPVASTACSPNGKWIVSGSGNFPHLANPGELKVWDATSGQQTLTLKGHTNAITSVAWSPDGKRIVSGSYDNTVRVWDAANGQETLTLKGHLGRWVTSVAFSPDSKRVVSGSWDKTLKVWDAARGQEALTIKGQSLSVTSVAFSPDSKRVVSGSWDKTLKVWDAARGQETLTIEGRSHGVAFDPGGNRIASGSDGKTVKVWDAASGRTILTLKGHSQPVISVAYSPDGKRIVSGSGEMDARGQKLLPGEVKVWNAATGEETMNLKGHTSDVRTVAYSPDGKRIVSGGAASSDSSVKVWDADTGQECLSLKGHWVSSVAWSPDGKRLAGGGYDETVNVWDAATGRETLTLKGHTGVVTSVAYSADGKRIVSGSDDKTLKVWDAGTGQETLTLRGHTAGVTSVAWSPDGKWIVSGGEDGSLKVWGATLAKPEAGAPE